MVLWYAYTHEEEKKWFHLKYIISWRINIYMTLVFGIIKMFELRKYYQQHKWLFFLISKRILTTRELGREYYTSL